MRADEDRVDGELRLRAVAALARDDDLKGGGVRHDGAWRHLEVAERPGGPIVVTVDLVDPVHAALLHHRRRAARPLLRGLEEEAHLAVAWHSREPATEERGRPHERSHVAVVAAQVGDALVRRAIRQPVVPLGHAKRVHVRAQRDCAHLCAGFTHGVTLSHHVDDEAGAGAVGEGALRDVGKRREHAAQ